MPDGRRYNSTVLHVQRQGRCLGSARYETAPDEAPRGLSFTREGGPSENEYHDPPDGHQPNQPQQHLTKDRRGIPVRCSYGLSSPNFS